MRQIALPEFPWDTLEPHAAVARAHPDGIINLSIGTPIDPTPELLQAALRAASDAPGYPTAHGTVALRQNIVKWLARKHGVTGLSPAAVLPLIGSKELIGTLPALLGLDEHDTVVIPALAYPTYAVSAAFVGAQVVPSDGLAALGPQRFSLVWINSPSNPTGRVLPPEHLRKMISESRARGAVLASDECYLDLSYDGPAPLSVLHPSVNGGSLDGLLAVHSLSKRSNFAGYRGGFVAGDPVLISRLLEIRKHLGFMVPTPVQHAMTAAYAEDGHVEAQRERYAARRTVLQNAFAGAGFRIDNSEAGLYLWLSRDEGCWDTVSWLAARGVLVAPGSFYGAAGRRHVRAALTASDEQIASVAGRL